MAVHLCVAPPEGCDKWTGEEWDRWLVEHPWEPAETVANGDWLVFLYMVRVHAPKAWAEFAPFQERLITEKPMRAGEVEPLRAAFRAASEELGRVPASRLWTGTQFYTPEELLRLVVACEERTGRPGAELFVADLWAGLLATVDRALARARELRRGLYFGHL